MLTAALLMTASHSEGTNITSNEMWVSKEMEAGVSTSQLAVGVGTMATTGKWNYNYTEQRLRSFASWLQRQGVANLDVWRADLDYTNGTTDSYYYDVLAEFLAGVPVLPPATPSTLDT